MLWTSLVVAAVTAAAEPCEAPRVRDTAPLVAAMAQDKVMALTFTKPAALCVERGEPCDQARLECSALLTSTIQKQVGFDEGQWLRDMLLPYNGASYPMTRTFGSAAIASDATCNVDVATLTAASQRRNTQAARRDAIFQEYGLYARWTQTQLQKCKERVANDEAKSAVAKAESERLAAASAAAGAAEAIRLKQAQEAAAAKTEAEKRAREAADAEALRQKSAKELAEKEAKKREDTEKRAAELEAQRQAEAKEAAEKESKKRDEREKRTADTEAQKLKDAKELAEKESKKRDEAEARARDERQQDKRQAEEKAQKAEEDRKKEKAEAEAARKKDKEEAEARAQKEKAETERKQREAEDKRVVTERDTRVSQQRLLKDRLVSEAEDSLKRAKDDEALKKQTAIDAVSSSPAIAQAAVAEAAQAERVRVDAEKRLVDAKVKADAIIIDDSFERSTGSVLVAGGGGVLGSAFALGVMGGAHFGFWGTAPPEGMASGFELRLWGRYSATLVVPASSAFDSLVTARYFFGPFGVGVAGALRLLDPALSTVRGGVGPAIGAAIVDTRQTRVLLGVNYLPLGNTIDPLRLVGDFEVSWRFITFHLTGGTATQKVGTVTSVGWQIGGYVGLRASW